MLINDSRNDIFTAAAKPSNLKTANRKAILHLLRESDILSVTVISEKTGLSRTTAMKTINYLQEKGYVVSAGKGHSTFEGGKKPEVFAFNRKFGYVFCVSLLPTCIEGALIDLNAEIIDRCKIGHAPETSAEAIVENIALAFRLLCEKSGINKENVVMAALGCDGIVDAISGTIINSPHYNSWQKRMSITEMVEKALGGSFEVIADNNVRLMAHADLDRLSREKSRDVIALMAQYGVGGCVIHCGQVMRGANFELGEFGHQIVNPFDEELCECGGKGCFEKMIIEERVLREAGRIFGSMDGSERSMLAEDFREGRITMQMIFDASNMGDPFAQKVMDWVIMWFAVELHNMLLSHDPQAIIIYGTYTTAGEYFFSGLKKRLDEMHFRGKGTNVEIVPSEYDTETAILSGAAKYAIELFFDSDDTYVD